MSDGILARSDRLYAAINQVRATDLTKVVPIVEDTDEARSVLYDFSGGKTQAELANEAHSLASNIGSLKDKLKAWARLNGKDSKVVEKWIDSSPPLQVIIDLWNADKHTYPLDRERSGKSPRLENLTQRLRLTASGKGGGSGVTVRPDAQGRFSLVPVGSGSKAVVVSGEVVDGNGDLIGDFMDIANAAVEDWKNLLKEFGLIDNR